MKIGQIKISKFHLNDLYYWKHLKGILENLVQLRNFSSETMK